jgi:protein-tyrosine phosphatase
MQSILFVCLGNICRSPIAEGVAKKLIKEQGLAIKVDSCGTSSFHAGEHPCANSITIAKHHSVDISKQRSRQFTQNDIKAFELIIALDQSNYDDLKRLGANNVMKLGDFGFEGKDVPDPYYYPGLEGFEQVYTMIEGAITDLLAKYVQN